MLVQLYQKQQSGDDYRDKLQTNELHHVYCFGNDVWVMEEPCLAFSSLLCTHGCSLTLIVFSQTFARFQQWHISSFFRLR